MNEELFPIKGFEGLYSVTKTGEVYSHIKYQRKRGKFLKKRLITTGYLQIDLSTPQKITKRNIHRLVAETFIPNPKNKPCVNHKNGVKTDNRVENLEWVTKKENHIHAHNLGLLNNRYRQTSFKTRKLSDAQVSEVIKMREAGFTYDNIASNFGVCSKVISNVYRNRGYKYA